MSRTCTICNHSQRLEIDRMLVQGKPISSIARKFSCSPDALHRHRQGHISDSLARAMEHKMSAANMVILDDINELVAKTKDILTKAESQDRLSISLAAIREIRSTYALLADISFKLAQAKNDELLIQQSLNKEIDADDQRSQLKKITSRLTESELNLYLLLCQKINGDSRLQREISKDGLDHDSSLMPDLELEDLDQKINTLCIQEHQAYCKENNVEYEPVFSKAPRQKQFKEGIKKLTAKPTKTKKMKRRVKAK